MEKDEKGGWKMKDKRWKMRPTKKKDKQFYSIKKKYIKSIIDTK